ncbi:hypothetical protein FEM48_Zijuj05G0070600 [Ziziphus jujuba var. spinosa]|uniref:DUF1421 domain-containing protein n=1 Tax=Ziziphus jujuba var. spinosa TaxID=714518 RepID=A0A978VDI4_ZIZJJ|nr:hypothetical protein FEM48_Zijuj05G0070600 [Ziziphus jujuba var. spinosa]
MKSSDFMDKQIMELSRSYSNDFSELSYPHEDDLDSTFRFYPIRPEIDPVKASGKSIGTFGDSALISMIECKIKDHTETMLHAVEGLSMRLCQVESKTRQIEHSVEDLKDSTKYQYGRTEGKVRELENILREVQCGVLDLRDKQEISEVKLQIANLQMLKGHEQSENKNSNVKTSLSQVVTSSVPQQSHQLNPTPVPSVQQFPSPHTNVLPIPSHQNLLPTPTVAQYPSQLPQDHSQLESNCSQPVRNPESTHRRQYPMPPIQQSQPPPPTPHQSHQPYQPVQQISAAPQLQQLPEPLPPANIVDPQAQHSMPHSLGEMPYMPMPSQSYSSSIQGTSNVPGLAPPSRQNNLGSIHRIHDQSSMGPSSDYHRKQPSGYSNLHDGYSYSELPSQSHYGSSRMKPSQLLPYSSVPSGGSNFSQLPTAQILPRALPMASDVESATSSSGTGNRIPVEDIIDNVVAMGFRRDTVRATVRKMTEKGQSVDLNVVLDKLMNNGEFRS